MNTFIAALFTFCFLAATSCSNPKTDDTKPIRAYDIDFNWGEGGPNGFAAPG
jgi:hypothetical protein